MANKSRKLSQFAGLEDLRRVTPTVGASQSAQISVSAISPGRVQYRLHFDEASIQELADIFRQHGFKGAVWVEPDPADASRYLLISGERRWRAAIAAGLDRIPVEIIPGQPEDKVAELGYIANSASKSLNLIEDTRAVLDILARALGQDHEATKRILYALNRRQAKSGQPGQPGLTDVNPEQDLGQVLAVVEQTCDRIKAGTWQHFTRNRLPLLNLPAEIMQAVESGQLDGSKAQVIARVKDDEVRLEVLEAAIASQLSKREIQAMITRLSPAKAEPPVAVQRYKALAKQLPKALGSPTKARRIQELLTQLEEILGDE